MKAMFRVGLALLLCMPCSGNRVGITSLLSESHVQVTGLTLLLCKPCSGNRVDIASQITGLALLLCKPCSGSRVDNTSLSAMFRFDLMMVSK